MRFPFHVDAVDRAGVPWQVAACSTPFDAMEVADEAREAFGRGVVVWAYHADNVDLDYGAHVDDVDSPEVERWLSEQDPAALDVLRERFEYLEGLEAA